MKTHTVLAIGAHVGDAELTAGALLATCAVHGGKAVTLALTAGEKGARLPCRQDRPGRSLCQGLRGRGLCAAI